jgi:6-phosphofructokinase
MAQSVGILTAGGDSPGLNAAIRAVGKSAQAAFDMYVVGFLDGFRGLTENRFTRLDDAALSGILTVGGTILGTSRDKPDMMPVGGKILDMTDAIVENYQRHHLDALVCLGGGGTMKSALLLARKGLNIVTLPKTIDNDVSMTDITFGFDTALGIATEAIDRLHSTAHSHHRIIVVELMGHNAGWLALGAGIAGGADVILIPELPYRTEQVAEAILKRSRGGKHFSIVAVAEGAMPVETAAQVAEMQEELKSASGKKKQARASACLAEIEAQQINHTAMLSRRLEEATGLEARVTILGHVQRGGTPSALDRLLATRLGTACAQLIHEGKYGIMVAVRGDGTEPVPLELVAGKRKVVPPDHPWIASARQLGTCLGD